MTDMYQPFCNLNIRLRNLDKFDHLFHKRLDNYSNNLKINPDRSWLISILAFWSENISPWPLDPTYFIGMQVPDPVPSGQYISSFPHSWDKTRVATPINRKTIFMVKWLKNTDLIYCCSKGFLKPFGKVQTSVDQGHLLLELYANYIFMVKGSIYPKVNQQLWIISTMTR